MSLDIDYKGVPWVKTSHAPMKYHAGYKTAISLSGKATVIISKTIKTNGAGNAPACSAQQKICSLNLLFFLM